MEMVKINNTCRCQTDCVEWIGTLVGNHVLHADSACLEDLCMLVPTHCCYNPLWALSYPPVHHESGPNS